MLPDKVPGVSGTGLDGYSSIEPFGPRPRRSVEGLRSMGLRSQGPVNELGKVYS